MKGGGKGKIKLLGMNKVKSNKLFKKVNHMKYLI